MSRRRAALRAMASQDVSPHERDIARAKLEAMGPPESETFAPDWSWVSRSKVTVTTVGGMIHVNIRWDRDVG